MNIPSNVTHAWELCSTGQSGFRYKINPKASQWIYEELLGSGIRMLKYSGDQDAVVSTIGTEYWIEGMNLTVSKEWFQYRLPDKQVAGYIEEYKGGLTFATVHQAGHMVPSDQAERSYHLTFNWMFQRGEFKKAKATK